MAAVVSSPGSVRLKFLRMKPGFGEVLLAEGDPRLREDEERLVEEFRRQLDEGMWAAVPTVSSGSGRREAQMVRDYAEIPTDAERVIFFPRATGGLAGSRPFVLLALLALALVGVFLAMPTLAGLWRPRGEARAERRRS